MFEWLFGRKKEVDELKEEVKKSFEAVKKDLNNTSLWVKHLNVKDSEHDSKIDILNDKLSSIESDVEGLKNMLSFLELGVSKQLSEQSKQLFNKQTAVEGVQTAVQTAVQTDILHNFSVMERAIVWILLNTDLKLSYEDISAMLGKDKATIRGQVNSIKQKSDGLIQEFVERNGKKRLFIPERAKERLLKGVKVRVKRAEK
ncbi:hypothetical protein HYT26_02095 [Candidatus Pacearchaeota archaeon]|nr:hypothetical protein [Candidatus Pacearchaeota archaeon]